MVVDILEGIHQSFLMNTAFHRYCRHRIAQQGSQHLRAFAMHLQRLSPDSQAWLLHAPQHKPVLSISSSSLIRQPNAA
jgi:hypothetical protein